jgi:hypothetical protein
VHDSEYVKDAILGDDVVHDAVVADTKAME